MKFKFLVIGAIAGVVVAYFRTRSSQAQKQMAATGPATFRGSPTGSGFGG